MANNLSDHLGGFMAGGDHNAWYPALWEWMCRKLDIHSVIDVGCGEGYHAKFFQDIGCEVLGVDGSEEAKENSLIADHQILHDYSAGPFVASKTYDLVWSSEFVEHVEEQYTKNFLKTFECSHKYVFMTHAMPEQVGHHHVNCQKDEYWIRKMRKIGFRVAPYLTACARIITKTGYFPMSGLVFIKSSRADGIFLRSFYFTLFEIFNIGFRVMRASDYYGRHGFCVTIGHAIQRIGEFFERYNRRKVKDSKKVGEGQDPT